MNILKASGSETFLDEQNILYGDMWRDKLEEAINRSTRFFIFWSKHSESSKNVKEEIDLATNNSNIKIVPIMLDNTPMPATISIYNGESDYRSFIKKSKIALWWAYTSSALLILLMLIFFFNKLNQSFLPHTNPENYIVQIVPADMQIVLPNKIDSTSDVSQELDTQDLKVRQWKKLSEIIDNSRLDTINVFYKGKDTSLVILKEALSSLHINKNSQQNNLLSLKMAMNPKSLDESFAIGELNSGNYEATSGTSIDNTRHFIVTLSILIIILLITSIRYRDTRKKLLKEISNQIIKEI